MQSWVTALPSGRTPRTPRSRADGGWRGPGSQPAAAQPLRRWLCSSLGPMGLGLRGCLSFFPDLWGEGAGQEEAFRGQGHVMRRDPLRRRGTPFRLRQPTQAATTDHNGGQTWSPGCRPRLGRQEGGSQLPHPLLIPPTPPPSQASVGRTGQLGKKNPQPNGDPSGAYGRVLPSKADGKVAGCLRKRSQWRGLKVEIRTKTRTPWTRDSYSFTHRPPLLPFSFVPPHPAPPQLPTSSSVLCPQRSG